MGTLNIYLKLRTLNYHNINWIHLQKLNLQVTQIKYKSKEDFALGYGHWTYPNRD